MKKTSKTAAPHVNSNLMTPSSNGCAPRSRLLIPGLGLAIVVGLWMIRVPLQERLLIEGTLANDAPTPEVVEEMITQASDPLASLLAAWNSGKVIHREVAMASVGRLFPGSSALPSAVEAMVLAGTMDPDANVRESAFGVLRPRNHPATFSLAVEQLHDPDQRLRLLGLNEMKGADPAFGGPIVAALLDDADLAVVGLSLKLLENWSGQKFGSKLVDTVQVENESTGLQEFQTKGIATTRAAAANAKAWWIANRGDFSAPNERDSKEGRAKGARLPAPDFELNDLDGKGVRLSTLKGRVVLINFWTTWCTACVGEMPALVALQARYTGRISILGVSLDYVPDGHGHIGGHAAVEEQTHSDEHDDDREASTEALKRVREKVVRVAKARGVNYPVLLDEHNDVGGQFNGGELPTTVLIDAQGFIRRRFVGARSLPVFEAMIAEAMTPLPEVATSGKPRE